MMVRTSVLVASLWLLSAGQPACGGETLYNGIVLPNNWPPRLQPKYAPMHVPYLNPENIPAVIPIDVGRQLFVDDFLIENRPIWRGRTIAPSITPKPRSETRPALGDLPAGRLGEGLRPARLRGLPQEPSVQPPPTDRVCVQRRGVVGPARTDFQNVVYGRFQQVDLLCDVPRWDSLGETVAGRRAGHKHRAPAQPRLGHDLVRPERADPSRRYKMFVTEEHPTWSGRLCSGDSLSRRWDSLVQAGHGPVTWEIARRCSITLSGRSGCTASGTTTAESAATAVIASTPTSWRLGTAHRRCFGPGPTRWTRGTPTRELRNVRPELYNLDCMAYESLLLGQFCIWQGERRPPCGMPSEAERNSVGLQPRRLPLAPARPPSVHGLQQRRPQGMELGQRPVGRGRMPGGGRQALFLL